MRLLIEKLVAGGLGLARREGEVLLLPGALPGEEVLAEAGAMARGVRRARVLEVLQKSPFRVPPDCPLAERCGGCDFLHVEPGVALGLKSQAALGELAERAGVEIELLQSPQSARYRGRATVHLSAEGVGFYGSAELHPAGGHALVEFDDCLLLPPAINAIMKPLRRWAAGLPAGAGGADVSLLAGEGDSGLAICFSPPPTPRPTGRGRRPEAPRLSPLLVKALGDLPLFLADLAGPGVSLFASEDGRRTRKISGGPERLPVALWPEFGLTLCAAPGGFTQVNPGVNRLLVQKILEFAAPLADTKATALDLYSGLGNIALPLARAGFAVTAVEESPMSVAAARENGRGIKGFTILSGRSEQVAPNLAAQGKRFRLAVLDPPRAGARNLAPALASLGPEMILYVACHPAVLGRDVPAFASLGYGLKHLATLDMFPRTSHLEALAVLVRR